MRADMRRHHPTPEQVDAVARVFEEIGEIEKITLNGTRGVVDMDERLIVRRRNGNGPPCGATACHSGWYALHRASRDAIEWKALDERWDVATRSLAKKATPVRYEMLEKCDKCDKSPPKPRRHPHATPIRYEDGALAIAEALGFAHHEALESYYGAHPKLWGNPYGDEIFTSKRAFGIEEEDTISLADIMRHWRGVARRTREQWTRSNNENETADIGQRRDKTMQIEKYQLVDDEGRTEDYVYDSYAKAVEMAGRTHAVKELQFEFRDSELVYDPDGSTEGSNRTAQVAKYRLVDKEGQAEDHIYESYDEAVEAARRTRAVEELQFEFHDSELVYTPDGSDEWPRK